MYQYKLTKHIQFHINSKPLKHVIPEEKKTGSFFSEQPYGNQGKLRISQHLKKVRQKGKGKTRVC